jgi:hypothetical protein
VQRALEVRTATVKCVADFMDRCKNGITRFDLFGGICRLLIGRIEAGESLGIDLKEMRLPLSALERLKLLGRKTQPLSFFGEANYVS